LRRLPGTCIGLPRTLFAFNWGDWGFSAEEVEQQLRRARNIRHGSAEFTWERITRIGFINASRQEVIRKTDVAGIAVGQRVYVLRCADCGHEHRTDGCDIHTRRCPRCQ
jgi:hypothetical protein